MLLHVLMLLSVAASFWLSFRRPTSRAALLGVLAPFGIGTVTMWVAVAGMSGIAKNLCADISGPEVALALNVSQRPIYLGSALTLLTIAAFGVSQRRYTNLPNRHNG